MCFDALHMDFRTVDNFRRDDCPLCGDDPIIKELIDYEDFCGISSERNQIGMMH